MPKGITAKSFRLFAEEEWWNIVCYSCHNGEIGIIYS